MAAERRRYCPQCATRLVQRTIGTHVRLCCVSCDFVCWYYASSLVAALFEYDNRLVFARNVAWPHGKFGLITWFLEPCEDPAAGVAREVAEELALEAEISQFIGAYGFARNNQLLLAYHLYAAGEIRLNDELQEYRLVAKANAQYWHGGTGRAVRDWLWVQGYLPQTRQQ